MIITWYGEGCFKLQLGETLLLTDPFSSASGLTPPRFKADLVLKTINPFPPSLEPPPDTQYSVAGAGEYNFKNINILGLPLNKESTEKFLKTVYLVEGDSLNFFFLGHISEPPEKTILEPRAEIDILFIPAGGQPFIDQQSAVKIIKQLQPKIVIPSFFKVSGLKRRASDIKPFLEELNHKKIAEQEKLSIKKKELSDIKSTQVIILKT